MTATLLLKGTAACPSNTKLLLESTAVCPQQHMPWQMPLCSCTLLVL
jgi:hypothetical protein